ncbi:MAG: HD domain-containing protein [Phaeodactylibacter sp.]|nr:HD domain-containing protein [Phaeodactylibacter sp.]MCB9266885.1 HD domain-containing protein [Lewinellaceae bacterium]MCB9290145.1 HD domain-containing protein [Lewinellaceae bacterium]
MKNKKILNDPVYGFVGIPEGIIFQLIEHPYFQRLRRIKQTSLTHFVYPGALHTRFHHAIGALHLMQEAIEVLRSKGVSISEEEAEGACIAILLHDIGHGPFSHTLEHTLFRGVTHEELSLLFMERLNEIFEGQLSIAMDIFRGQYPKQFLHQLVSGQLDMDRMDYLNRDSFFTGVHEGVIGYDRIIKMLSVRDGELVVEEKGIYSIEKFLIARRLMYWQVYLHKTVLAAELMLIAALLRAKALVKLGRQLAASAPLSFFLQREPTREDFGQERNNLLEQFARLDDFDIVSALKNWMDNEDQLLAFLSSSIINRRLFRLEFRSTPFEDAYIREIQQEVLEWSGLGEWALDFLLIRGKESNSAYTKSKDEIRILHKSGEVFPMSQSTDYDLQSRAVTKYYLCYPKALKKGL